MPTEWNRPPDQTTCHPLLSSPLLGDPQRRPCSKSHIIFVSHVAAEFCLTVSAAMEFKGVQSINYSPSFKVLLTLPILFFHSKFYSLCPYNCIFHFGIWALCNRNLYLRILIQSCTIYRFSSSSLSENASAADMHQRKRRS